VKQIAAELKVARGTVRRTMKANGLAPAGGSHTHAANVERDAKIAEAVKGGQTVAQVAETFGLSKGRARRIMKANGYVPTGGGARFAFESSADRAKAAKAVAVLAELGEPLAVLRAVERDQAKKTAA
jgi:hypothetical protein